MKIYTYFTLFILLLSVTIANSTILRVPNQYRTIEIAIEFAEDGDTVLVGRGTYDGPINFAGKNIVIASNYIISYQQQDINQTILQGSGNGRSVVVIRNGEAEGTELNGFTVRNGDTDYGGGIYISGSSANLRNLVVLENNAQVLGGGVYITNNADVVIENSLISSNVGYFHGGGISVRNASDVKLKNTKFLANRVDRTGSGTGGGIQAYGACIVEIDSCVFEGNLQGAVFSSLHSYITVKNSLFQLNRGGIFGDVIGYNRGNIDVKYSTLTRNVANNLICGFLTDNNVLYLDNLTITMNTGAFALFEKSRVGSGYFRNSIVHNNSYNTGLFSQGVIHFEYIILQGGMGRFSGTNEIGESIIDEDPMFVNPDEFEFNLQANSSCIDSGHPDELDLDGTRRDIGAFPRLNMIAAMGRVYDIQTNEAIEGATINIADKFQAITDNEGNYDFPRAPYFFDFIQVTHPNYLDEVYIRDEEQIENPFEMNFALRRPVINLSANDVSVEMFFGDEKQESLLMSNIGSGRFDWTAEVLKHGILATEQFDLVGQIPVSEIIENDRTYAAVEIEGYFYVASGGVNDGQPVINVFDSEFNLIREFNQPTDNNTGFRTLTWDGEVLWGGSSTQVIGMNLQGDLVSSFETNGNHVQNLIFDQSRNHFWLSSTGSNIYAYDLDGNQIQTMLPRNGNRIYGLGTYDSKIYMVSRVSDESSSSILFMDPDSPENGWELLHTFDNENFKPYGIQLINKYTDNNYQFVTLSKVDETSSVAILQFTPMYNWIDIDVRQGTIDPNEELTININIVPYFNESYGDEYSADIVISNEVLGDVTIPVTLSLSYNSVDGIESTLPTDFTIESIYPNPFNSFSTVRFTLPSQSQVKLAIYDINGRLVQNVVQKQFEAGVHSVAINGQNLASGVYFVRLDAGNKSISRKALLLR